MTYDDENSVTRWIADLKLDCPGPETERAQQALWERYFRRLVSLANTKLGNVPRAAADEEDVALNALQSFFNAAQKGQYPQLYDRNSLWPLLAKITAHKAVDQRRKLMAKKRGAGRVRGNSAILGGEDALPDWPDALLNDELRPDFLVAISEQFQILMDRLGDDQMRKIALLKLEGYSNAEIATQLGVIDRTVVRRLGMIRDYWIDTLHG